MKSRRLTIRLSEPDFSRLEASARDHCLPLSEYARALLRDQGAPGPVPADDAERLARIETLCLAAAVSSYEAQVTARAALTPEQAVKLKEHRRAQFAAWRAWGVQAAYLGDDMRPKKTKEPDNE